MRGAAGRVSEFFADPFRTFHQDGSDNSPWREARVPVFPALLLGLATAGQEPSPNPGRVDPRKPR